MCVYCTLEFDSIDDLTFHKNIHKDEERPYKCLFEDCNLTFRDKAAVRAHFVVHKNSKKYSCSICAKKFNIKQNLMTHLKGIHKLKNDEATSNGLQGVVDSSENEKSGNEDNDCLDIVKKFKIEYDIYRDIDPLTCEYCFKHFSTEEEMESHLESHEDDKKPYKCPDECCTITFLRKSYLQKHYYMHIQTSTEYKCQYCQKILKNPLNHREHEKKHLKPNQFLCTICGEYFYLRYLENSFDYFMGVNHKAHLNFEGKGGRFWTKPYYEF